MADKCKAYKTSIGGQAVMEGVMMRGPESIATAVRKPDKEIIVDKQPIGNARKSKFVKLPIIRGCVNFIDSMVIGIKALMFSAKFFDIDDEGNEITEEPGKFEKWLTEKLGSEKAFNVLIYISVALSVCLSVGLFMLLPAYLAGFVELFSDSHTLYIATEGVVRITLFVLYLVLVSQMKDIKRVFMYHGAEHKSIHCYEHGEELTVENVRKHTRLHPRCGTSFLLLVMVISIILFFFIRFDNIFLKLLARLVLIPLVAGISYEIIKFAGRHDNWFTRIISYPGMLFQHVTTREPDDSQIEVAIASLMAVIPEEKGSDQW
ncbi:MAG: DUF1385 domain-containing protein [Clostridia bacterium]|nr:DUF1385 domain-containing protein [Clostridia bacterium]